MKKTLEDVKQELGRKYLGKAGIHGLGIDRSEKAIRIYHKPESVSELEELFEQIEKDAHPYKVVGIRDEPAKKAE